jgi:ABC-2 type transport system permease protein
MSGLSLSRIVAVISKEFTQLVRDRLTYGMILGIPIMQLMLFGYAINSDPKHLPAAVLVQDHGALSRSVIGALQRSGYFDIVANARSPAEMNTLMDRGEIQFAITIPGDFTRRVVRHDAPQVLVEADASDPTATGGALAALAQLPQYALMHDLKGPLAALPATGPTFDVVVQRRYNPENITSYNIVPGLIATILTMTLVMMTALAVTRETERGTMEMLLSTPVRPLEVMIGKLSPYVVVGVVQATIILVLARLLFGVPLEGGWGALIGGMVLFIVGNLALGFLISTVARNQLQAMQMGMFYFLPSILLSGFLFPFRGMPVWAQWLGTILPITHMLRIVRGSVLKGVGVADQIANLGALALFVVVVAGIAIKKYRTTLD